MMMMTMSSYQVFHSTAATPTTTTSSPLLTKQRHGERFDTETTFDMCIESKRRCLDNNNANERKDDNMKEISFHNISKGVRDNLKLFISLYFEDRATFFDTISIDTSPDVSIFVVALPARKTKDTITQFKPSWSIDKTTVPPSAIPIGQRTPPLLRLLIRDFIKIQESIQKYI